MSIVIKHYPYVLALAYTVVFTLFIAWDIQHDNDLRHLDDGLSTKEIFARAARGD